MKALINQSKAKLGDMKNKLSLKNAGITSAHVVPLAVMSFAGIALSAVISDVPPSYNHAFAATIEEQATEICNFTQGTNMVAAQVLKSVEVEEKEEFVPEYVTKALPEIAYKPLSAVSLYNAKKEAEEKEETKPQEQDLTAYATQITSEEVTKKLEEIQEEKERLAREEYARKQARAASQPIASSNRSLYLDHYSYQRGPSNIPNSDNASSLNTAGVPISQMQMPASLTFDENGVPNNYLYCIEGKSTAYCGGYMTATGSSVRPGVVAVDPREIPYGTEMWIVSSDGKYVYGFARAEDTGGFVHFRNGATVDLYMNSYEECCNWGWRGVKIYILPTSYN